MYKILVTGASGFVGKHLTKALLEANHTVFAIESSSGNIALASTWENFPKAEIVIHLAAKTFVPDSWIHPDKFIETNVNGTLQALEYCRKHKAKLVFLSSYLYGNPKTLPIKEDAAIYTLNPYAFSKKTAEDLCCFYNEAYRVQTIILRPFNIYGVGQSNHFLIPTLIEQIKYHHKIEVKDIIPKRDYIYITDVTNAIIQSLQINSFKVIHLGSGVSYSVKEIIDIIQNICNTNYPIITEQLQRPAEIMDTIADITKANIILNWQPTVSIQEGLKIMVEAYTKR
jgi:nucleoside-diphosphate-sugar epimerase